jgi:hypothetical protein
MIPRSPWVSTPPKDREPPFGFLFKGSPSNAPYHVQSSLSFARWADFIPDSSTRRRTATTAATTFAAPSRRHQRLALARLVPLVRTSSTSTIVRPFIRFAPNHAGRIDRAPRGRWLRLAPTCVASHPRRRSGAHSHPLTVLTASASSRAWLIPRCHLRRSGIGIGTRIGGSTREPSVAHATTPRRPPSTCNTSGHRPYFAVERSTPRPEVYPPKQTSSSGPPRDRTHTGHCSSARAYPSTSPHMVHNAAPLVAASSNARIRDTSASSAGGEGRSHPRTTSSRMSRTERSSFENVRRGIALSVPAYSHHFGKARQKARYVAILRSTVCKMPPLR